ncbi:MAG: ATP-binding protein [Prevotellaceae bacterium]|nr:ATP-binding protein [Prevotellaceae bacterium]
METQIRNMPIGIQDFEKLRTGNYVYVDKTAFVYRLAQTLNPYFLSRPRRFGKSLFLSTLKYYFLGEKELFEGLKVAELEKDWIKYPVFHIEFNIESYIDVNSLNQALESNLSILEKIWGKDVTENTYPSRFRGLIRRAAEKTGKRVVVLVDEYDKPLLSTMHDEQLNEEFRTILKGFYGVLKGEDANLRFAFLTGVTKFSKVSIFSDLNQLRDISMTEEFAEICGISETELKANFTPDVERLAERNKISVEAAFDKLKQRYDGYHFSKQQEGVYNPFSLLNVFADKSFGNYWFATGTPTFLVKMLKGAKLDITKLEGNTRIDALSIMDYRAESKNPVPVMYQSGYLTIRGFDEERNQYELGYPNEEVKYGFLKELLSVYYSNEEERTEIDYNKFVDDLLNEDVGAFMQRLQVFFSGFSYDLENKTEKHYQTVFYILFALMGQRVAVEPHYAVGRPDAVLEFKELAYIFEFKLDGNGTAEEALQQIEEKDYAGKYHLSGKKIIKVGVEFDHEKRNVKRWKVNRAQ